MQLKRLDTGAVIELPDSLFVQDEFGWSALRSNVKRTLNGQLLVQQSTVTNGKPIVISAPNDMGWVRRAVVTQIKQWAEATGLELELTYKADSANKTQKVIFDHTQNPIEAVPVEGISAPDPTDYYQITLRLLTV